MEDLHTKQQRKESEAVILTLNIQKQQAIQQAMLAKIYDILSSALEPRIESLIDLTRKVWDQNVKSTHMLEKMALSVLRQIYAILGCRIRSVWKIHLEDTSQYRAIILLEVWKQSSWIVTKWAPVHVKFD